jgi:UPF0271 protein
MLATVRAARDRGIAVGAHQGYPDLVGFGRRAMTCTPDEVYAFCLYQIGALAALYHAEGVPLYHVKAHGALYNQSARDPYLARALARATRDAAPALILILLGLPGSQHEAAAHETGIPFAAEAFADRAHQADGSLAARAREGSVLYDPEAIAMRVIRMVTKGTIETAQGEVVTIRTNSICVHRDGCAPDPGEGPSCAGRGWRARQSAVENTQPLADRTLRSCSNSHRLRSRPPA